MNPPIRIGIVADYNPKNYVDAIQAGIIRGRFDL
jgi:hypothetical protein